MARTFQTRIPRPHLVTVHAVRVDWPVPDSPHLPERGTRERAVIDRFVAEGAMRDVVTEQEVRIAYEVFDGERQSLGLVWKPWITGINCAGEWMTYQRGCYVGTDRLPYRYSRSLTEAVQELARREHRRLQDAEGGRRRRADARALAGLTHG
ncbi:hypothetical protein PUR21_21650 [Methylorubrum rhodesianum]|uniref:Uncharacterized protein n=1 Tax=Methylorubrum rhodesianum TaxID=29427 RepID=A0ABU9ZFH1_9HYPH